MYLNFSNFRGRISAGGGQALVQKRGQVSDGGGLAKFSPDGGTPPVPPPRKKTLQVAGQEKYGSVKCNPFFYTSPNEEGITHSKKLFAKTSKCGGS